MWWTLRFGSPMEVFASLALPHVAFKFFFYLVFQAIGVYFNLYFLIPRYLEKGRYLYYVNLLLITIISTASLVVSGYYISAWLFDKPFQELYHMDTANYFSLFESSALPSTAASMTLAMSIKLTRNWIQIKRREQLLETENLENDFKHVSQHKNGINWINLNLYFDQAQLRLAISNSVSPKIPISNDAVTYHGIGLKNVQRRLDLLYRENYDLKIEQEHERFRVTLELNLAAQGVETDLLQLA
jgi:hypothetical protein